MKTKPTYLFALTAALLLMAGCKPSGINNLVTNGLRAGVPPDAPAIAAAAMFTYDEYATIEKLLLSYQNRPDIKDKLQWQSSVGSVTLDDLLPVFHNLAHETMNRSMVGYQGVVWSCPYYVRYLCTSGVAGGFGGRQEGSFWQEVRGSNENIGNLEDHIIASYSQPMQDPDVFGQNLGPFEVGKPLKVPNELKDSFRKILAEKNINADDPNLPPILHQVLAGLKDGSFWEPYN
jgi:hypothetical protein